MNSITLRKEMEKSGINLANADCLEEKQLAFERALKIVIPPKDQSDRTSFRNISNWLAQGCLSNKFNEYIIFRRVLDFALEASSPSSRNPAAVFTSILKKELGYKK
jgi:hypothetical protein